MNQNDRLPDAEPPSLEELLAKFVVVASGIAAVLFAVVSYFGLSA